MKSFTAKKMRGLTLIEALLFLGIAAVVIVGAVAFYNNASNTTKLNAAKTQLQAIGGGIQSLYASQSSYTTVTTSLVVNAGLAPQNTVSGNALVNPWGGTIVVTGAARTFDVEYTAIPSDACVNFLSAGLTSEGGIIRVQVNGSSNFTTDPNPAQAVSACSGATNSLAFQFR